MNIAQAQRIETATLPILSLEELMNVPQPDWLIDSILPDKANSMLFGNAEAGKSFAALDMALSIATGHDWHGHAVKQGRVLYVAAEGAEGLGKRLRAWAQYHQVTLTNEHFTGFPRPINLRIQNSPDVAALIKTIRECYPDTLLVVFDTLSRCMEGTTDESNGDMAQVVANVDRIRQESGANILLIHHTTKGGGTERGGSALRDGMYVSVKLTRDKQTNIVTFTCDRTKDSRPFEDFTLQLQEVAGSFKGEDETSLVLVAKGEPVPDAPPSKSTRTRRTQGKPREKPPRISRPQVVKALHEHGEAAGPAALVPRIPGATTSALKNLMSVMRTDGELERVGRGKYWPTGSPQR